MNELVANKLDRARPALLSRLRRCSSGNGIPDNLRNAVGVYLLLDPDDREVRQARDRLISSTNQPKQT